MSRDIEDIDDAEEEEGEGRDNRTEDMLENEEENDDVQTNGGRKKGRKNTLLG